MSACPEEDIVNGGTPIENEGWGVHPRLYLSASRIRALRECVRQEPWATFLGRTCRCADSGMAPHAALAWLLTSDERYRAIGLRAVDAQIASGAGHGGQAPALLYDWLYADLAEEQRRGLRDLLHRDAQQGMEKLARHEIYWANAYVCNIGMHTVAECALPAFALYGDVPGIAPWLRFVLEKTRVITAALGPDGASAEGICYGGVFNDYYVRVAELVRLLLGWDPFAASAYGKNVPLFYLYSMVPRAHLRHRNVHLHVGDSVRWNWCGPDYFLRRLASAYRDPVAQWVADAQAADEISSADGTFFNLLWYDPAVPAALPPDQPRVHHFRDKDLVIQRSGWDGDESVFAFHCGPHAGYHALQNYTQCIAGGHMAPDAGSFQLFAHGDWLISDGGYARKFTAYRNTVLVNGIGQTGEGGEWFECRQLRAEKRGPSIRTVMSGEGWESLLADAAPAYDPAAGLSRFLRFVLYVRPDTWVLVDELEAQAPSVFAMFFHAWEEEFHTDRPFQPEGERCWVTGGKRGRLRLTSLAPDAIAGGPEIQHQLGIGPHRDRDMCTLRLANATPTRRAVFLTVLEAGKTEDDFPARPLLQGTPRRGVLTLATAAGPRRFRLSVGRWNIVARPDRTGRDSADAGRTQHQTGTVVAVPPRAPGRSKERGRA